MLFFKSSTDGSAKTGVTSTELATAAARILLPILFIFIFPLLIIFLSKTPHRYYTHFSWFTQPTTNLTQSLSFCVHFFTISDTIPSKMSRYALVYDKCQSFQKRTGIKLFIFLYTLWTNVPHIRWYCRYFHYISCVWCMNHLTSTYINTYMPNSYTNISWLWITYLSQSNEITGAICM